MTVFYIALGAGLLGGAGHCSGMCGPIVAAFSMGRPESLLLPQLLYNLGRVITYTALGWAVGAAGSFLGIVSRLEGAQYALLALTGLLMLSAGLAIAGGGRGPAAVFERYNAPVLRIAGRLRGMGSDIRFLPLGLVLGLLPCGLSYTMLIGSAGAGGPGQGALIMLGFGLGTVPSMFMIGALAGRFGRLLSGRLYRIGGALVALMGAVYLYRAWVYHARL